MQKEKHNKMENTQEQTADNRKENFWFGTALALLAIAGTLSVAGIYHESKYGLDNYAFSSQSHPTQSGLTKTVEATE